MRRVKPNYFVAIVIIIAIVGVSIVIPVVYFSESYKNVTAGEYWTPAVSETPTRTTVASLTFTPQKSPTLTISPSPTVSANCVYPDSYWEENPELWLEMLVGNTMYVKDDIRLIFENPSQEIHQLLLKQLYLANLNIFSGADPTPIREALGDANAWLQKYLPDKQLTEGARLVGVQLMQTLIEFNTGVMGPSFCPPYEALTITPVVFEPTRTPSPSVTVTATRRAGTQRPTATSTKTEKPDKPPKPTNPPKPTDKPDPTDPSPTKEPNPTDPPAPTAAPTSAPPDDTPRPTDPPKPTDPPGKSTPTPAS